MDRQSNPGINPGNGPATWTDGKKPMQPRKVDDTVPPEFTSALPSERREEAEGADSASKEARPSTGQGPSGG